MTTPMHKKENILTVIGELSLLCIVYNVYGKIIADRIQT